MKRADSNASMKRKEPRERLRRFDRSISCPGGEGEDLSSEDLSSPERILPLSPQIQRIPWMLGEA